MRASNSELPHTASVPEKSGLIHCDCACSGWPRTVFPAVFEHFCTRASVTSRLLRCIPSGGLMGIMLCLAHQPSKKSSLDSLDLT